MKTIIGSDSGETLSVLRMYNLLTDYGRFKRGQPTAVGEKSCVYTSANGWTALLETKLNIGRKKLWKC